MSTGGRKLKTFTIKLHNDIKRKETILLTPKPKIIMKKRNEIAKHQENIRQILQYTNATPIRCHRGIGYTCSFCPSQFAEPADLKKHTLESHDENTKSTFMVGKIMQTYVVKLDITNLRCEMCENNVDSIEEMMQHLTTEHDKKFNFDIKSHIIPFRFDSETFKCVSCSKECNNFKVLLEHMNVHFGNHVCEICGCGFVNISKLQTHGYRHKTGEFKCSFCDKIFDNRVKQKDHERAVHVYQNKRSKCGYCSQMFSDYTKKNDHEVKEHGVKAKVIKCHACDKSFDNQRSLTVHTKSYHMMWKQMIKSSGTNRI